MTDAITHFFFFFALAFLSGLFWPAFHAMIGAPESVPDENAGLGAQFVKTLKISKPSMIFGRYGEWLCRKQNEFDAEYDLSRLFYLPKHEIDSEPLKITGIETSFARGGVLPFPEFVYSGTGHNFMGIESMPKCYLKSLSQRSDFNKIPALVFRLFHGEVASIRHLLSSGEIEKVPLEPIFPDFNRSKMPLSPYKALGLCPNCTVFWIMFFTLISACFVGLFPASWFWLILPAYGLAIWGTQIYE